MKNCIWILAVTYNLALAAYFVLAAPSYPDGTLIFSYSDSFIGRQAQRITQDKYTHVAIVLDGKVYEADWPRVKSTPLNGDWRKKKATYDFYVPKEPFTDSEIKAMKKRADFMIGMRYSLKTYWDADRYDPRGIYCSPYAGKVLSASDRYQFTRSDYYEPQDLFDAVSEDYQCAN